FSESVIGVNATDFVRVLNGVAGAAGASITSVTGNDGVYTVTVDTGAGSGTVGLNLVDNDTVVDNDGAPIGGTGFGSGNAYDGSLTGPVYNVCKTPPWITCPGPVPVQCASAVPPSDLTSVTASTSCLLVTVNVTYEGDVISNQTCANKYTITRTYKATDSLGQVNTCTQIITVNDTTGPSLTVPTTGLALGCNPAAGTFPTDASVAAASSATDTCSATTISATHTDSTTGCVTTRDFTVTAKDACLNATIAHAVYTWTTDASG